MHENNGSTNVSLPARGSADLDGPTPAEVDALTAKKFATFLQIIAEIDGFYWIPITWEGTDVVLFSFDLNEAYILEQERFWDLRDAFREARKSWLARSVFLVVMFSVDAAAIGLMFAAGPDEAFALVLLSAGGALGGVFLGLAIFNEMVRRKFSRTAAPELRLAQATEFPKLVADIVRSEKARDHKIRIRRNAFASVGGLAGIAIEIPMTAIGLQPIGKIMAMLAEHGLEAVMERAQGSGDEHQ